MLFDFYAWFNYIEAVIWVVIGLLLPLMLRRSLPKKWVSIFTASIVFFLFGLSDYVEAPLAGHLPWWLWCWKIFCGAALLACRYWYQGWQTFRFTDREFIFGTFCLLAVLLIMWLGQSRWLLQAE